MRRGRERREVGQTAGTPDGATRREDAAMARILVIDDDVQSRRMMSRVLTQAGHIVHA
jgi:PleD family two-component response regulator